jgi:hypothetical protein
MHWHIWVVLIMIDWPALRAVRVFNSFAITPGVPALIVLTSDNDASRNPFVSATSGRGRCSDTDPKSLLEDRQSVAC